MTTYVSEMYILRRRTLERARGRTGEQTEGEWKNTKGGAISTGKGVRVVASSLHHLEKNSSLQVL